MDAVHYEPEYLLLRPHFVLGPIARLPFGSPAQAAISKPALEKSAIS